MKTPVEIQKILKTTNNKLKVNKHIKRMGGTKGG